MSYHAYPSQRRSAREGPQTCTRIPPWHQGTWVKIGPGAGDLADRVLCVKALTCAVNDEGRAVWRCSFESGRCVRVTEIERQATEAEVRAAQGRARA